MVEAFGGLETVLNGYRTHTFLTSAVLRINIGGYFQVLVVAGGQPGGYADESENGEGGRGGEVLQYDSYYLAPGEYSIVIGASAENSILAGLTARTGYGSLGGIGNYSYGFGNPGADGTLCALTGTKLGAGGGAGASAIGKTGGVGGTYGGGKGGDMGYSDPHTYPINGDPGTPNTGGGGGGGAGSFYGGSGMLGGSGLAIVKYRIETPAKSFIIAGCEGLNL